MVSAVARVLGIAELLELILFFLPPRDLLLAQGISRNTQSIIQQSPKLQQALFLRAIPEPTNPSPTPRVYHTNTLLEQCFPYFFIRSLVLERSYPFITERASLKALPANSNPERTRAFMRAEASWRCMLVSNPPVTTLTVATVTDTMMLGQRCIVGDLRFQPPADGLRMGVLYDIVLDFVAQHQTSSFCLKWHCLPRFDHMAFTGRYPTLGRLMPLPEAPEARITLSLLRVVQCPPGGADEVNDLDHLKSDAHAPLPVHATHVDIEHFIRQDLL